MGVAEFHPDLQRTARVLPRAVLTRRSFRLVRLAFRLAARVMPIRSETVWLDGGQRLQLHRPAAPAPTPTPALLWIHGGGLVIGDPRLEEQICSDFSAALGIVVAAPSYRLAPRHPFPAARDDLDTALRWLATQPGIDPDRIAIGGDSAGGGLAACLALHAAARPGPRPRFLLLHEPMLDEATRTRPDPDPASLRMWTGAANRFGWNAYLAGIEGPVPATASAARASDAELAGLPPTWLGVGTADLFHDETSAFADRLRAAGKLDAVVTVPGAFHSFATLATHAPVSRDYRARMTAALARGLGIDVA